jgi:alcohol dehydrogenase class IV
MAIYLPIVAEFNCIAVPQKFAFVAEALGEDVARLSIVEAAKRAPEAIRKLAADLHIPCAVDVGVRSEDFPRLAKAASVNGSLNGNPRVASEQDFLEMFEAAQTVHDVAAANVGDAA